jgi:hypothetical protein
MECVSELRIKRSDKVGGHEPIHTRVITAMRTIPRAKEAGLVRRASRLPGPTLCGHARARVTTEVTDSNSTQAVSSCAQDTHKMCN